MKFKYLPYIYLTVLFAACGSEVERAPLPPDFQDSRTSEAPPDRDTVEVSELTGHQAFSTLANCIRSISLDQERSVGTCLDTHSELLKGLSREQGDSLYLIAVNHMQRIADGPGFDYESYLDKETWHIKPGYAETFRNLGYILQEDGEGGFYLRYNPALMKLWFEPLVSQDMAAYLSLDAEHGHPIAFDAAVAISAEQLAARILAYEDFLAHHEVLSAFELSVMEELEWELEIFFTGLDNTPIFDWSSEWMDSTYIPQWKRVQQEGGKVSREVVSSFLKTVAANGYKKPDDLYGLVRGLAIRAKLDKAYKGYPEFIKQPSAE